ncbi:hypothetical protein DM860_004844 [Cuscuta australis]|uniref:BHLH domain-containing protein n=1 Tax=Cuscuta australis TaxID=267555 RepID=A0A328DLK1_9ASTE|nr:hypothetical protein DM860_004844 [Cuscuta australis]
MQSSPESDVVVSIPGDLAVLERQRAIFQRFYPQQHHHQIPAAAAGNPFPAMLDDANFASHWNLDDSSPREAAAGVLSRCNSSVTAAPTSLIKLNPRSAGKSTRKRKAEQQQRCLEEKKSEGESWEAQSSEITVKSERQTSGHSASKQSKKAAAAANSTNYIHVRARRGQATDSHSLAERARREKISKKMKCLQDLVPGCNKVVGKAGMLDEIINYVQSLQKQVEFLSMKLAVMNPTTRHHHHHHLDFAMDTTFFPKEVAAAAAYMGEEEEEEERNNNGVGGTESDEEEDVMAAQQRRDNLNNNNSSLSIPDFYLDSSPSSYFTVYISSFPSQTNKHTHLPQVLALCVYFKAFF